MLNDYVLVGGNTMLIIGGPTGLLFINQVSFGCEYKGVVSGYRALSGECRSLLSEYRALLSVSGRTHDAHHRRAWGF